MAWVALGVGQLVAGIGRPQGSPVAAVGSAAIDRTPPPVKNFAISAFGSHDKTVLIIGILVVLAVFSAIIGVAAMRSLRYGYIGLAIFAVIGLAAALTRPDASPWDVLPTLIGALAGGYALGLLVRAAGGRAPRGRAIAGPGPRPSPGPRGAGAPPPSPISSCPPTLPCPRPATLSPRNPGRLPLTRSLRGQPRPARCPGRAAGRPRPTRPGPRGSLAAAVS